MVVCGKEVERLTVVSEEIFIQDAGLALVRYICYPDTADADVAYFQSFVQLFPEWLVQFLAQYQHRRISTLDTTAVPWGTRSRVRQ